MNYSSMRSHEAEGELAPRGGLSQAARLAVQSELGLGFEPMHTWLARRTESSHS